MKKGAEILSILLKDSGVNYPETKDFGDFLPISLNANSFSKEIGLGRPQVLYDIENGRIKYTSALALWKTRICLERSFRSFLAEAASLFTHDNREPQRISKGYGGV